jgi:hypothetical protein
MSVSDGVGLAESGVVTTGADYDVRVRTRSPGGQFGDYSPNITIEATPSTGAPAPVTGVTSPISGRSVNLAWTMSPSSNSIGARVYRNTVNNPLTATLIAAAFGSPSTPGSFSNIDLAPGTYYYWIVAVNGSNFVESTRVATGAKVIT